MRVSSASQNIRYYSVIYVLLKLNLSTIHKLQLPDPDDKKVENVIRNVSLRLNITFITHNNFRLKIHFKKTENTYGYTLHYNCKNIGYAFNGIKNIPTPQLYNLHTFYPKIKFSLRKKS